MKTTLSNSNNTFNGLPKFQLKVDEKLIRGRSVNCPWRLHKMKKEGITQIIDLRNTSTIERPIERFFCNLLGLKYINVRYPNRLNTVPAIEFFEKINNLIRSNNGKSYIHCEYGKRRTGICVALYKKMNTDKSAKEIIEEMLDIGYKELIQKHFSPKKRKSKKIFTDFIKKYFPEEIKRLD